MILLNFRVHRASVNDFARCWRNPRRISFQRHPAFRAITRLVGLNAGTHRAKILCGRRGFYCRISVAVMGMTVMFVATTTIAGGGRGFSIAAATRPLGAVRRLSLCQKLLPAMFAAKIKRLPVAFGAKSRRFVHRHAADGVFGHINSVSFGWFSSVIIASRQPSAMMARNRAVGGVQRPAHQPAAASFMILTIAASTSCATPFSCGVLNSASRVVGFKVARMVLPPSS